MKEGKWFHGLCFFFTLNISEMLDFCDFLSPTPEEQASRNAAVECVFDVIKYIWPDCEVYMADSLSTSLSNHI